MGTWGAGNFDNDTSADHLSTLTGRLVREVEEAMADPEELEADEFWGCAVPANLELLTLLAKQHYVGVVLPDVPTVDRWKATYMTAWEDSIDGLEPTDEFRRARRKVLLATFAKLRRAAQRESG
ncbi:MAG: DUF4259 domain-containing protein [Polyangiales bacterium]|nr:DUF4259 domain-containing protein [Myxococcales bacterium]MCB9660192.1 DUF4259 domain-containing protein [Sandaracinaceae bacterium]